MANEILGGALLCCGVKELNHVRKATPQQIVIKAARYRVRCFVMNIVIGRGKRKYSNPLEDKFRDFITEYNLGILSTPVYSINPNTGNTLAHYFWTMTKDEHKNLLKYTKPFKKQSEWGS